MQPELLSAVQLWTPGKDLGTAACNSYDLGATKVKTQNTRIRRFFMLMKYFFVQHFPVYQNSKYTFTNVLKASEYIDFPKKRFEGQRESIEM